VSTKSTFDCSARTRADFVLEADAQPDKRLAEQLSLLLFFERPLELGVREQALAQEESAHVRAGLVLEEAVVQSCRPHLATYRFLQAAS